MKIHFIGIGGIGVSALAKYYLAKGNEVSGCDLVSSEITSQLKKMGVKIRIGAPRIDCMPVGTTKLIYSPAIPKTNVELKNAYKILNTKYQIQVLSYPEALGELTKTHYTIAISGTHGKSTTTAMLGLLLTKAGLNPTVIVGTKLKEFHDGNFRMGGSPDTKYQIPNTRYLVVEADEHFASFLNYRPQMIVLTNIEADHLDYYKTLANILKAFKKYISLLPKGGILIVNKDDKNTQKILNSLDLTAGKNIIPFSMRQKEVAKLRKILKIPGEHIVADALAALAVARALKIPDRISFKSLAEYRGAWRRFEVFSLKTPKPYTLVSDYGHNPTKVKVTVEGARSKWPFDPAQGKPEIWLVYQPHQYARTHYLFKDFVKVLSQLPIEKLILTDIFDVAGRENDEMRKKVSSEKLANAILNTKYKIPDTIYIPDKPPFEKIGEYLKKNIRGNEIVIVMGAGNIYALTLRLTKNLQRVKIR